MNNNSIPQNTHDRTIVFEAAFALIAITFLVYLMRSMLISGETTITHDNYYWYYPIFQFFADSIINGQYPLWNPFTHGGETFFPILFQLHLLDPLTFMIIYIGQFFTTDIIMLFNWNRFLQTLFTGFGIYLVLRPFARHHLIRISLISILLYSSLMLGSFRQDAILNQFSWVPFITYFLLRIVYYKEHRWGNWLAFAALVGLKWQSYFFSGLWIFFLFFIVGTAVFRRDLLLNIIRARGNIPKFLAASVIVLIMMMPNVVLLLGKDNSVYPARMIATSGEDKVSAPMGGPQQFEGNNASTVQSIRMPYQAIAYSGSFSQVWDLIQTISPEGNRHINWPGTGKWGAPSEAYIYLGMLPWAIIILGMLMGQHDLKRVWIVIAMGFGMLMLGPSGGVHKLLYYIYPPLWFVRHTHAFVLFFIFSLLYFYVLGCNHIYCTLRSPVFSIASENTGKTLLSPIAANRKDRSAIASLIFLICFLFSVYQMTVINENGFSDVLAYLALIGIAVWLLRNDLEKKWLYFTLLAGQILIVLYFTNNTLYFIKYTFICLGIPAILFLVLRKSMSLAPSSRNQISAAVIFMIFSILCGDLIYSLKQSSFLYGTEKSPAIALNIKTSFQKPSLSESRLASPTQHIANTGQSMRYLSLIYRQLYALSPVIELPTHEGPSGFEYALLNKLNSSFSLPMHEGPSGFKYSLLNERWSSFSLPKNYFSLINSDIPPLAIKEMFTVGKPVIQFKHMALGAEDDEVFAFLKKIGPERAVKLLDTIVFVNQNETDNALDKFREVLTEYESAGAHDANNAFSYSIKKYDYNSLNMDVSTEKEGLLYWSDGYDKNWHAYVDSKEVPVYRANINFKAIILPKGNSLVRFAYEYPLFKNALYAFYGTFILSCILAFLTSTRMFRRGT